MPDTIKSWSYSRLKIFEQCPYRAYLAYVEKRPEPPEIDKKAAERGTQIHTDFECYIKGEVAGDPAPLVAKHLELVDPLREAYTIGQCKVEDEWGFTIEWKPTGWSADDTWCRMKLDALHFTSPITADAYDWKSGKKMGNEVAHAQQAQAYVIGTFMLYPNLEMMRTRFVYVDQKDPPVTREYTRAKMLSFLPSWTQRAITMTTATEFPPKPNKINCRWCPYGPNNKGDRSCPWGIEV